MGVLPDAAVLRKKKKVFNSGAGPRIAFVEGQRHSSTITPQNAGRGRAARSRTERAWRFHRTLKGAGGRYSVKYEIGENARNARKHGRKL
jgi:hypothetical protein